MFCSRASQSGLKCLNCGTEGIWKYFPQLKSVGSILSEGWSVVWILITVKLAVSLLTRHIHSLNKLNVKGRNSNLDMFDLDKFRCLINFWINKIVNMPNVSRVLYSCRPEGGLHINCQTEVISVRGCHLSHNTSPWKKMILICSL